MDTSLKREEKFKRKKLILFRGEINTNRLEIHTSKFSLLEYIRNVSPDTPGPFQDIEIEARGWIPQVKFLSV